MDMPRPLPARDLCRQSDPDSFSFSTSDELQELDHMLGQDRAVEAIELGAGLRLPGFNLFVMGSPGTGRHSFIRQFLEDQAAGEKTPSDWCYVNNFDEPRRPRAIELPAGFGRRFRGQIERFLEEAGSAIPAAFEREDYQDRLRGIEKQAQEEQEKAFDEVQKHAAEKAIRVVPTPSGFNFLPLRNGEPITPEEYQQLSGKERQRLEENTEKVGEELRRMLQAVPRRVRLVRERIGRLNREIALFAAGGLIDELMQEYSEFPRVREYLGALRDDIVEHVDLFIQPQGQAALPELLKEGQVPVFPSRPQARYRVNLIVDNGPLECPRVVVEDHPTYPSLIGKIEHVAQLGVLSTNYNLIQAGALHRANGGYLIADVRKILGQPFAWEALKRALRASRIDIRSPQEEYSLVSTTTLEPDPIPLDVKVVLIGDRTIYELLQEYDPDFLELFKVAADFEEDMERSKDNMRQFAHLIAAIARKEKLRPLDRGAMAAVVDESSRLAGDAGLLSTCVRRAADLVREAHYWSGRRGSSVTGREDVLCTVEAQERRMARLRDLLLRETMRGTLLIDTEGAVCGQVNGLSVIRQQDYLLGRPTRITARLSIGAGTVIDIEREVELGGPIHSKGILILAGFLSSTYVPDVPLSLSASLVFEQSYGPVEGDSASAAELCALLSALADLPVRQSLAITGSVNQRGQVQAIGDVNEKIEGFFALCHRRGLSGSQGVILPAANVKNLMLRPAVVKAVEEGRFHIYPAGHIDDCMHLLTGREPGARDERGDFPPGSLNHLISQRLRDLAEKRRAFGDGGNQGRLHGKP